MSLPLDQRITEIRSEFPAVVRRGYLNTGTIAPLPLSVLRAHQARELDYHLGGPLDRHASDSLRQAVAQVRGKLAAILAVPTERIALAENTTAGVNAALLSQDWQAGDEIITSDAEHPAVVLPLAYLQRRFGTVVKTVAASGGSLSADQVAAALTGQTKAIVISHVSYSTGAAFDIPGICAIAQEHQVLTVVDGAQSAGAMLWPLGAADPDFFAFPGYKWLLGPQGTAGLYVSPRVTAADEVPYRIGSHAVARRLDDGGFELHTDARRFEGTATTAGLDIVTLGDSVDFLARYGMSEIAQRIIGLCSLFKEGLASLGTSVELITPLTSSQSAGLVAFRLAGQSATAIADELYGQGLIIRTVSGNALRASFHFYNTTSEVERLVVAIGDLISQS